MQPYWVLCHVSYLAPRWGDESPVNLHYCAGNTRSFAETSSDDGRGQSMVLRSVSDSKALADYAHSIRLPEA